MIIAVDMDLTLVRSDIAWFKWLDEVVGGNGWSQILCRYTELELTGGCKELLPYDPAPLYDGKFEGTLVSTFDFWENNHLYASLSPIIGAVEALEELKVRGHTIRIVSKTMKGHYSSKVKFIKRWFPFIKLNGKSGDAFVATHEKFAVQMDVLIDDRMENFKQLPDTTLKILFDTPYEQDYTCPVDLKSCNWSEIKDFIISMED